MKKKNSQELWNCPLPNNVCFTIIITFIVTIGATAFFIAALYETNLNTVVSIYQEIIQRDSQVITTLVQKAISAQ